MMTNNSINKLYLLKRFVCKPRALMMTYTHRKLKFKLHIKCIWCLHDKWMMLPDLCVFWWQFAAIILSTNSCNCTLACVCVVDKQISVSICRAIKSVQCKSTWWISLKLFGKKRWRFDCLELFGGFLKHWPNNYSFCSK